MPKFVHSADGTPIAYDVFGPNTVGPNTGNPDAVNADAPRRTVSDREKVASLVVIGGAFNTRLSPHPLVDLLAERFTVYSYDRRGRGDSADTLPYSIRREVEDLTAVLAIASEHNEVLPGVYGHSSGAIIALEAAMSQVPMACLAIYEPPYTTDPAELTDPPHPLPENPDEFGLLAAVAEGDRERAAQIFLKITGMDDNTLAWMKTAPFWPGMIETALTLPHDLALSGDGIVPLDRLKQIGIRTLALDGGASDAWAARVAVAVSSTVRDGARITIKGQGHGVDQATLAPILDSFFAGERPA